MEEGTFRGLFYHIAGIDHSMRYALFFQAFLFGVWHIVTPLHNLIDGDIDVESELTKLDGLLEQVSKKVDSPASPTVSVARPAEPEKKSKTMA